MEFQLTNPMLIPYIVSNSVAVLVLWLSFRRQSVAKGLLGLLFVLAGVFNIYTSFSNPSAYLQFADTALLPFYRNAILGFFGDNVVIFVSAISVAQMYVGLSMMFDDLRFKVACIGGVAFGLLIAPLGIGSAFPCSIILSAAFLVLLVVTKRDEKLNKSITTH